MSFFEPVMDFYQMRNYFIGFFTSAVLVGGFTFNSSAFGQQTITSVRSFDGGVAPLFNLTGPANLYIDSQGTQGFLATPGSNFQSFSFRNPTTGQAWSGAVTTLGPQLSIGLIQGANQVGSPVVLPGPPRRTPPLLPIQSTLIDIDDIP